MICDSKLVHDPHHFATGARLLGGEVGEWLYCEGRTAPAPPSPVNAATANDLVALTQHQWTLVVEGLRASGRHLLADSISEQTGRTP